MNRTANSPHAASFVEGRPSSSSFAVAEHLRQCHRPIRHARVRFIEPDLQPCNPVTPKGKAVVRVEGLNGSRAAVATNESSVKRFKVTVIDRVTGQPVEVLAKLEMRSINILCYGTMFHFTMKAGSTTAMDSRSGRRVSLNEVQSELNRMLESTEGEAKFAEFTKAKEKRS